MGSSDSPRRSAPATGAPLVTVATYSAAFEAQIARSALAAHGVRAFIADEHLTTLNPHYMGAALGIRLQVHHPDLERAAEILSATAAGADGEDDEDDDEAAADGPRCPQCEARYAYREWSSGQILLILLLLGIPLLFLEKHWHCRKCHAYWAPAGAPPRPRSPYRAPKRKALRG
jgi:hypothetical protein